MATREEIAALLYRLQDCYPQANPPRPGTIDEWYGSSVGDFPPDVIWRALEDWREAEDRFPTIHRYIEACQDAAQQMARERFRQLPVADDEEPVPPGEALENVRRVKAMLGRNGGNVTRSA